MIMCRNDLQKDYTTKPTVKTNDTISSTQLLPAVQLKWVGFVLNGKRFLLNHFVAQDEVIDKKKRVMESKFRIALKL